MRSTRKRNTKRRRSKRLYRKIVTGLSVLLLAAVAFVVEYHGGFGGVPSWSELYTALGVPMEGPDPQLLTDSTTTVSVLDVGQGDSVLIGQDGEYCLIDTGTAESREQLVQDLQWAGITELKYLVLTHPHADHTGGALTVLEHFPVEQVLLPVWEAEESPWPRGLQEEAEAAGVSIVETEEGNSYTLGSGVLHVLQGGSAWMEEEDDANNGSLCLLFEAGGFRYLATGDAEEPVEQALVDRYGRNLQATLYKAGHHGSSTSSGEELLEVVQPQAAVISCGLDNEYGHPHEEVLRRMEAAGIEIYRTDTMGTITFTYEDGALHAVTADTGQAAA